MHNNLLFIWVISIDLRFGQYLSNKTIRTDHLVLFMFIGASEAKQPLLAFIFDAD